MIFFLIFIFWLCCIFTALWVLSLVMVSGGRSSLHWVGFPLRWLLLLQRTGSRCMGFSSCSMRGSVGAQSCSSRALERGLSNCGTWLSCSAVYGIFRDQGSNLCPLHGPTDAYPVRHQGSPGPWFRMLDQVWPTYQLGTKILLYGRAFSQGTI